MKRISIKISIFVLSIVLLLTFAACATSTVTETYKFSLYLNGGTGIDATDFIDGETFIKPKTEPKRAGYRFVDWFQDKELTIKTKFGIPLAEITAVYARWEERETEIRFVFGAWKEDVVLSPDENGRVEIPAAERKGYEFKGWFRDPQFTVPAVFGTLDADTTFYSRWSVIRYKITYDVDSVASLSVNAAKSYTVDDAVYLNLPVNIKTGYEFNEWLDENGKPALNIERGSTGDRIFKAKFMCNLNGLNALKNNAKIVGNNVTVGLTNEHDIVNIAEYLQPDDRARMTIYQNETEISGEALALSEGENVVSVEVIAESGAEALYSLNLIRFPAGEVQLKVFYPDGSTSEASYVCGTVAEQVTPKTIAGYEFEKFYADSAYNTTIELDDYLTENILIYAKYRVIEYEIVYILGIGTNDALNPERYTVESGAAFYPPTVTREGYRFVGWTIGNETIGEIPVGAIGDKVLSAQFELIDKDPLFDGGFAPEMSLPSAELDTFLRWLTFNRIESAVVTLSDLTEEEANEFFKTPIKITDNRVKEIINVKQTGNTLSMSFLYWEVNSKAAEEDGCVMIPSFAHEEYLPQRNADFDEFKINSIIDRAEVSDSDQLTTAAERGYLPIPVKNSSAERLYNKAKNVLRRIADDTMTDVEKAHAIFDYLTSEIAYDYDLLAMNGQEGLSAYNGFYLEGVFDDGRAVCDGIAKAFSLLCAIEGISCFRVSGSHESGVGHAWNKIKIEDKWYIVDATNGGSAVNGNGEIYQFLNHDYFLITDAMMTEKGYTPYYGEEYVADVKYDYYGSETFVYNGKEYDFEIKDRAELRIAVRFFAALSETSDTSYAVDFYVDYAHDGLKEELAGAAEGLTLQYIFTNLDGILMLIVIR